MYLAGFIPRKIYDYKHEQTFISILPKLKSKQDSYSLKGYLELLRLESKQAILNKEKQITLKLQGQQTSLRLNTQIFSRQSFLKI